VVAEATQAEMAAWVVKQSSVAVVAWVAMLAAVAFPQASVEQIVQVSVELMVGVEV